MTRWTSWWTAGCTDGEMKSLAIRVILTLCFLFALTIGLLSCTSEAAPTSLPDSSATAKTPSAPQMATSVLPTRTRVPTVTPKPSRTSAAKPTSAQTVSGGKHGEIARVVGIVDGDTIAVEINGRKYSLRYIGIDTPEPDQPFGREATANNAELVSGQVVELEKDVSETDKYGRLLRYVWIGDMMVNQELVCQGYAYATAYPPDVKYQDLFNDCQGRAREENRGFWGMQPSTPTAPGGDCPYVGNKNTRVLHHAWCSSVAQMKPTNRVCFATKEEALAQGYRPCKNCKP